MAFSIRPFRRFPSMKMQISRLPTIAWMLVSSLTVPTIYGCATPYEPEGLLGGYRDSSIGNDQFHITVQGNGYSNTGMVEQYFYRRAAGIVKENSYAGYKVITFKTSMEPWGGMCCFPVATGVIQGLKEADKGVVSSKNVATSLGINWDMLAHTEVYPVLMPPTISNNVKRIAILPLSESFGTGVPAQLDYTVAFIRALRPEMVFVDRQSIEKVTDELRLQYSGRVDDETSKRVGRMVGADTLLLYRILPFDKTRASLVRSTGGTVSGGIEVHLIQVETGTSLFRQTVTAKTFFPPPTVATWTEEGVIRAHGIASEEAAGYVFAALAASMSINPLGVVPAVNEVGLIWGVLSSSPSEAAGFKKRDKIIQVNNRPFHAWTDRIDLPATITVLREGKELQLSVSSR